MQQKARELKTQTQQSYLADLRDIGDSESDRGENIDSKSALSIETLLSEFELVDKPASPESTQWILDSGATAHISRDRESFSQLDTKSPVANVVTASGAKIPASGTGCISIAKNKAISEVLYVPSVTKNLMSIGKLTDKGHIVVFNSRHCYVMDRINPSTVFLKGYRDPRNS